MNRALSEQIAVQLRSVLDSYRTLRSRSQYDDLSDLGPAEHHAFIAKARAAIERIAGRDSAYFRQAQEIISVRSSHDGLRATQLSGVVTSLQADVETGYLDRVSELLHGDVFGDFLEMASHLSDEDYKDAAAVIAGGTLEAHLRQLCQKWSIDITASGTMPKKADTLNAELAKASAYSKLDQKNITSWLHLRNKAAHAEYGEYTKEQVCNLISGIREFITRVPA